MYNFQKSKLIQDDLIDIFLQILSNVDQTIHSTLKMMGIPLQEIIIINNIQNIMQGSTPLQLAYLCCSKKGLHEDQLLNFVCLETSCLENLLCCCACVESEHKKHSVKPLKSLMRQVRVHSTSLKSAKMNLDVLLNFVNENKKQSFELFQKYKLKIMNSLQSIQLSLQGYYNLTVEQLIIKNTDSTLIVEEAINRAALAKSPEQLKMTLKKIVAVFSNSSKPQNSSNMSQVELMSSLKAFSDDIRSSISVKMQQANRKLSQYQTSLTFIINNMNVWQHPKFQFSQTSHHQDVQIIDSTIAKSIKNSGYKFAMMEPSIEKHFSKTFSIRVKESSSNWLAIGLCHKKIIQSKNYGFVFGSIGHGAYLISSNGGSWSSSKTQLNNTIKSFKFVKGDVISITVNSTLKKIHFKSSSESYELPYEPIAQDELHPCVLFYYMNDQVQYLPIGYNTNAKS